MKCRREGCPSDSPDGMKFCSELCRVTDRLQYRLYSRIMRTRSRVPEDAETLARLNAQWAALRDVLLAVDQWSAVKAGVPLSYE